MPFGEIGSLLSSMSATARLASPFIESLATIGGVNPLTKAQHEVLDRYKLPNARLSTNRIQSILRESGLGIRRTDLLSQVRHYRGEEPSKEYIKALKNDVLPDASRFAASARKMETNYQYTVRLAALDPNTGERTTLYRTVSTNTVLTKNQTYTLLADAIENNPGNYPYQFEEMVIEAARSNPAGVVG